jgi:hypothetical protein
VRLGGPEADFRPRPCSPPSRKTPVRPGEGRQAGWAGDSDDVLWSPRGADFCLDGRGYYRCKRCRSAAVARRRRKVKAVLVEEAGGACAICGYDRNMRALHFHHVDPSQKRHEINAKGVAIALDKLRVEAQKCVLLCSNCHAEVEDGTMSLPGRGIGRSAAPSGVAHIRSGVTQLAECEAVNFEVVGSSPTPGVVTISTI